MSETQTEQQDQPIVGIPENLSESQALLVLVNAVGIGQKAGIYTLAEAELISKAVRKFSVPVGPSSTP